MTDRLYVRPILKLRGLFGSLCVVLSVAGCADNTALGPKNHPQLVDSMMTADVARALNADGTFLSDVPESDAAIALTAEQARARARQWIRTILPLVHKNLEQDRKASFAMNEVDLCGRIYYAETPFEPLPKSAHEAFRRTYGPWWIVPLCVGKMQTALLGIAATTSEDENERGAEFTWQGIHVSVPEHPVTPEAAVAHLSLATRRRVATPPRLVMPLFREGGPSSARWRMTVDSTVTVQHASGLKLSEAKFFYGAREANMRAASIFVASAEQPTTLTVAGYLDVPGVTLARKQDHVVRMEPVSVSAP